LTFLGQSGKNTEDGGLEMRKALLIIVLLAMPFLQGCALLGAAVSAGAAYAIYQATK
jgi:hypothetical protein